MPPDRVPWDELEPEFLARWGIRPDGRVDPEHLEILGPTGSGKTHFQNHILKRRVAVRKSHVVVIATKPADQTLKILGWPTIKKWPPRYNQNQVIYGAKASGLSAQGRADQREKIQELLDALWQPDANRVLVIDEIAYLQHELGLGTHLTTLYREGRSIGLTIVANTQRPQGITRWMHSESKWKIAFLPEDEDDAERVAQVLGNKKYYRDILMELDRDKHEFIITHGREAYISHIPKRSRRNSENDKMAG
jgi:hypothetical protein